MGDGRVLQQHHRGLAGGASGLTRIRGALTGARAAARQAIPEQLRRDVRLLGGLLGQVIAEQGGKALLADVEKLRRLVISARHSSADERAAERLVASWSIERAEQVARAFTCYFHLANLAEEHHRTRVLRERERESSALPDSLAGTVQRLKKQLGSRRFLALLRDLEVHPVFTAHPTEARRRAVVTAIRRVGDQLASLEDAGQATHTRAEVMRRLLEEVDVLWRTGQLRTTQLQPLDEVRAVMSVFDETLFRMVPEIYRGLDAALEPKTAGRRPPLAPAFLRFGSWVGGDRDGNPTVTAAVTAEAMEIQAEHALIAIENAATRIGRALTADAATTPASKDLRRRLERARAADPRRMADLEKRSPSELHRQFLLQVADRIRETRLAVGARYTCATDLISDLTALQASLASAGAARLAYGEVQHLIWQAQTFGLHLAELEVRQHSSQLTLTREVVDTFQAIAAIQRRFGPDACRRFIVSFTRGASDVAAVYDLAEVATGGAPPVLDVVPLFETAADLRRITSVLDDILELNHVKKRLAASGRRFEVMLGYSDSAKEVGPTSATLALYEAQAELARWAARRKVTLTIFHGRGGALGRGGGPANRAVRAQAPGSVAGRFKVTEQGEVIFARYSNHEIARRHIEQVSSAVLEASTQAVQRRAASAARRFRPMAHDVDVAARAAYRELVEAPGFEEWFAMVSPVEELGRMRIASRPARRGGGRRLEDLRAIPWVFAWSQTRLNLAGWYGLGSGLAAARLADLKRAYASWPLFNVMLDNAEMSLAKTDRQIARRYLDLGGRADLAQRVLDEYDRTLELVLAVTGHRRLLEDRRVLSWAIELRNPYVDALSHLQLRALRELRARRSSDAERLLLLTVNGVAAGLQNTG
ncbi:MAG TPA: phosphoenolpyruvate carboxylase [Candidatus Dormibacteraeota bacterium]|nr:phosphoenolpyruvate carboxylase [Candidatus Dormibacteraeota bacterium]